MGKKILTLILCILLTSCKYHKYTIKFIDDNKELATAIVKYGDNLKDINAPEKEGYIFLGWLKDGLEYDLKTPIKEDITLVASWVEAPTPPNMHKVIFDFGETKKSQTIEDGSLLTAPKEVPKKEKYKFIGWYLNDKLYDFNTPVTEDITIIAKFEKNRIIITYDLDGASGLLQVEITKGKTPSIPKTPIKFGYTFTIWTINGVRYDFDKPLYEDTTIKANYVANVYVKVTFDTNGGNTIPSQMLVSGSTISKLPVPEKEGYTFLHWEYNDIEFDKTMKIEKDITLIAIYEQEVLEENNEN